MHKLRKGKYKPKHLVAVYGTLRKGLGNHPLVQDAELIMTTRINGFAMHSLGAFPAVRHASEDSMVTVEVYHINDMELHRCDLLEGCPDFYQREVVGSIDLGDGEQDLNMYLQKPEQVRGKLLVQSGDWIEHLKKGDSV